MLRFVMLPLFLVFALISTPQAEAAPLPIANVTASSEQFPNVAENTIDDSFNTRWSAKGDGEWIEYELESCEVVFGVGIAWYQGDRRVASFAVETSEDGRKWKTVYRGDSEGNSLGFQDVNTRDQFACFVRIVGYGTSVNEWNSITAVTLIGVPHRAAPFPDNGVSIPITRIWASDEDRSNVAANAIDGDFNTRWSARAERWIAEDIDNNGGWLDLEPEDKTTWIAFELAECPQGEEGLIYISWYQGDRRVSYYTIEYSRDGEVWGEAHIGVSYGNNSPQKFHVAHTENDLLSCFIRIVGYGNTFNPWVSITEVMILGTAPPEYKLMN